MMTQGSITQIGNVHYSNAESQAYTFGLPHQFVDNIRNERNDLTSKTPLIGGIFAQVPFAVAEASRGDSFSPTGLGNSGRENFLG